MERKTRLRGFEIALQVADAAFAVAEQVDDGQARLVGQGVEERPGAREVECGGCGGRHGVKYINKT